MLKTSTRCLRKFQSQDAAVAKLFAKHIKLPEAIDYVKRTKYVDLIHQCVCLMAPRIGIGIGTPQRLIDLLEKGVMKTKKLKRIVIDGSHLDQKKRSIFDMKELLDPLIKLFSVRPIKDRLDGDEKRIKVLVF
jgi:protein CMS1